MRRPARARWLVLAAVAVTALCGLPLLYLALEVGRGGAVAAVLSRPATYLALARTIGLAASVAALCLAIAVPLAWLTHATDLPGRRAFRVLLVLPLAVPSYVGGFVVVATFAPGGFWPAFDPYGPAGAIVALAFTYPLALLTVQASLDRLDPRLWESARSLGCSAWGAFFRVVLPQLRPAMAAGALVVALYAVGDFGAVSLTRYESLSYLVYLRHKSLFDREEAAVLSLLLVAVSALLALALLWIGGRAPRQVREQRRAWPTVPLGRLRWPCALLCAAVAGAGVGGPVAVVTGWLLRGLRLGNEAPWPWAEAARSLGVGAAAAALLVLLSFALVLAARFAGGAAARRLQLVSYLGYALPGIVVALALISLATDFAFPLYQTLALLLLAYAVRFLPLAVGALDDAVSAQSRELFWAARGLGCSPAAAWRRVILPSARPAVVAGALAVFIAVVKELPVTLLLSPIEFSTLATRIWALTEDAYFAAAAPAVLLLIALSAAALLARPDVRRREGGA